jgi:outer membrane protein assembly factor BamE (lipoprotein component of BamABCDE complex)
MTTPSRLIFTALAALALAACAPRQQLQEKDVKSVIGMTMDQVESKLGGPYVVTNAGDSVWWDYNDVTKATGNYSTTCQIIFVNSVATKVKC